MESEGNDYDTKLELTQFESKIMRDLVSEVSENPLLFTAGDHLFTLLNKFQIAPENQLKMMHILARELSYLSESCSCELRDSYLRLSHLASAAGKKKIAQQPENNAEVQSLPFDKICEVEGKKAAPEPSHIAVNDAIRKENIFSDTNFVKNEVLGNECSSSYLQGVEVRRNVQVQPRKRFGGSSESPSSSLADNTKKVIVKKRKLGGSHQCNTCRKIFTTISLLDVHIHSHTVEVAKALVDEMKGTQPESHPDLRAGVRYIIQLVKMKDEGWVQQQTRINDIIRDFLSLAKKYTG